MKSFQPCSELSIAFPSAVLREDDNNRLSCVVDDEVFRIPNDYSRIGGQSADQVRRQYGDDDDQLLQYAIRQSVSGGEIAAAAGNSASASTGAGATANGSVVNAAKSGTGEQPADKTVSSGDNAGNADTEEVDIWEALQVSFLVLVLSSGESLRCIFLFMRLGESSLMAACGSFTQPLANTYYTTYTSYTQLSPLT